MLLSDGSAFTVFFLIFTLPGVTAAVSPPADVNVSCSNLKIKVAWRHPELQPQTVFHVQINGSQHHLAADTRDLQYDLTPFIWSSQWHYLDFYYVTVTALQGGATSRPVFSKTFTFNHMKMADIKCKLDFPPVRVTADESGNTVIFRNPFIFYRELNELRKQEEAFFKFTVSSDQGDCDSICTLKQPFCKCTLPSSKGPQVCVTLRGWLYYGNGVENVEFHQTDGVCTSGEGQVLTLALTLTFILLFIVIFTVLFFVVKMCRKSIPKPSVAVLDFIPHSGRSYHAVIREDVNPLTVEPRQVCCKNLQDQNLHDDVSVGGGGDCSSGGADDGENAIQKSSYTDGALLENSSDQEQDAGDLISSCSEEEEEQEENQPMERSHYDRQHVRY